MVRACIALGLVLVSAPLRAQEERFTAWALNMSNVAPGTNTQLDIVIERWSADADRERLMSIFTDKGQDALLSALQKIKPRVGYINIPSKLSWDLKYARQVPGEDGGRKILIATDRKIGFREVTGHQRSLDYPFTLIEIHLDQNNEGEGRASVATKITLDKKSGSLALENFASEPVRLENVKKAN